jgi:cytochrome c oxidase assembly protein Cox11
VQEAEVKVLDHIAVEEQVENQAVNLVQVQQEVEVAEVEQALVIYKVDNQEDQALL